MKTWSRVCVLAAAVVGALPSGCTDEPTASEATGAGGGGGGMASGGGGLGGGGGAGECPVGSHAEPGGGCVATLAGWGEGPPLAQRRDHHLSFVVASGENAALFAAGGIEDNATLLEDIEVASIQPDGSVAGWSPGGKLPAVTAGGGVAVVGGAVVVTGGYRLTSVGSATLSSATDVGRVMSDGTLGGWTVGPKLAETRFHHAMVAHGATLYVIGGLTGDNTDNTTKVERAFVDEAGGVSAWSEVTPLPVKRSHHSAAVHEDAIYVTGGLEGDPAGSYQVLTDVLRAAVQSDGSLGAWTEVGHLPVSLTTHASFVHAGALYLVGGIEGDVENTAAVRRAAITSEGALGPWEEVAALPKARAHAHQAPMHEGFVYAVAGALNHQSIPDVFIGRFE